MSADFKIYLKEITINTSKKLEVIKVTNKVQEIVNESGINDGLVVIHAPHATVALIVNEYEPRIVEDYLKWIERYVPPSAGWRHDEIDDNAYAHIASAIIGSSKVVPVHNGRLMLGRWQEIMLVELDGPRTSRKLMIQVLGK